MHLLKTRKRCIHIPRYSYPVFHRRISEPSAPITPTQIPEQEPDDPAVEAMLQEIDFSPHSNAGAPSSPTSFTSIVSSSKRPRLSPGRYLDTLDQQPIAGPSTSGPPKQMVLQPEQRKLQTLTSVVQKNTRNVPLNSTQLDIRRFLGGGIGGSQQQQVSQRAVAYMEEAQNPTPQFAYLKASFLKKFSKSNRFHLGGVANA